MGRTSHCFHSHGGPKTTCANISESQGENGESRKACWRQWLLAVRLFHYGEEEEGGSDLGAGCSRPLHSFS